MCHEEWVSVRSRLGLKGDDSTSPVSFHPRAVGLAWAPPGLPAHKVSTRDSFIHARCTQIRNRFPFRVAPLSGTKKNIQQTAVTREAKRS